MTLYGTALFVHIGFGIALVGGSIFAHVTYGMARRQDDAASLRPLADWLAMFGRVSGPIAGVTVIAGLYMAFAGDHWGAGWPSVALALFVIAGATAAGVLDPRIRTVVEMLDGAAGQVSPGVARALRDPVVVTGMWTLGFVDLAILWLMTNKPGLTGSIVIGLAAIALGTAIGLWEARHVAVDEAAGLAIPPA